MNIRYNQFWNTFTPTVSIVTACYNRRVELPRAMESVRSQTFKKIEYIIVDDGSSEDQSVQDIVYEFMDSADFPVAFIEKDNGGVHTARNAGFRICRGQYCMYLDSDDEYLPNCVETMLRGWESVPFDKYYEYREVNAYSMHDGRIRRKGRFPENINLLPYEKAKALQAKFLAGDKIGMFRADLMRANPWPEPEGVTQVAESILWTKLGYTYKTWFLDEAVLNCHFTEISLTRMPRGRSNQQLTNKLYNSLWFVNHGRHFGISRKIHLKYIIGSGIFSNLLHRRNAYPMHLQWAKKGVYKQSDRFIQILTYPLILIGSFVFTKKYL